MKYNRIFWNLLFCVFLTWTNGMIVGCSEDNSVMEQSHYGYVQFNVYKSASYDDFADARAINKLNFLDDAKKIEVFLQRDGATIAQTLVLNSYNELNAEFGLRSEKLKLLAGDYSVSGYHFYDNLDQLILTGETDDNFFTVVGGGLTSKALPVESVGRGMVSFKLVK